MSKQYLVITGTKDPNILRITAETFGHTDRVRLEILLENFQQGIRMNPTLIANEGDRALRAAKQAGWEIYELKEGIIYKRFAPS